MRVRREPQGGDGGQGSGGEHDGERALAEQALEAEDGHAEAGGAHGVEGPFEGEAGTGGLADGLGAKGQGVPADAGGGDCNHEGPGGVDDAAGGGRQEVGEKSDADVLAAGKGAGGAKEAESDHEAAGDVVGPFDGVVEDVAVEHAERDHDEVGGQKQPADDVDGEKEGGDEETAGQRARI